MSDNNRTDGHSGIRATDRRSRRVRKPPGKLTGGLEFVTEPNAAEDEVNDNPQAETPETEEDLPWIEAQLRKLFPFIAAPLAFVMGGFTVGWLWMLFLLAFLAFSVAVLIGVILFFRKENDPYEIVFTDDMGKKKTKVRAPPYKWGWYWMQRDELMVFERFIGGGSGRENAKSFLTADISDVPGAYKFFGRLLIVLDPKWFMSKIVDRSPFRWKSAGLKIETGADGDTAEVRFEVRFPRKPTPTQLYDMIYGEDLGRHQGELQKTAMAAINRAVIAQVHSEGVESLRIESKGIASTASKALKDLVQATRNSNSEADETERTFGFMIKVTEFITERTAKETAQTEEELAMARAAPQLALRDRDVQIARINRDAMIGAFGRDRGNRDGASNAARTGLAFQMGQNMADDMTSNRGQRRRRNRSSDSSDDS